MIERVQSTLQKVLLRLRDASPLLLATTLRTACRAGHNCSGYTQARCCRVRDPLRCPCDRASCEWWSRYSMYKAALRTQRSLLGLECKRNRVSDPTSWCPLKSTSQVLVQPRASACVACSVAVRCHVHVENAPCAFDVVSRLGFEPRLNGLSDRRLLPVGLPRQVSTAGLEPATNEG